ncbi:MAG: DNA polymerase III subunit alpha [Planctomycetota bacterium]|nr:MAG: DNA polymerase III subunit alpha [Planctomycetota bacterium]
MHYLAHEDAEAHDVLCCINTGSQLTDEDRFRFPTDQFYFKSPQEMASLFPEHPEALENTLRVARMCDVELDLSTRHAPVFRVPDSIRDERGRPLSDADYLRRLVYEGAEKRYGTITDELRERIDYELEVITSKGFASYFLIVWDCVNFARRNGIPVGARGSGCSAVVSYCLFISDPDPIRYGLYFERFMDPDRDEMPDIDLDICQEGRARVIEYVRETYGHVAQIITFNTLKARAVVKDVARVLGMGFEEANRLTKLIPFELKMTLEKALAQEPELKKRYDQDPQVRRIIDIGRKLEGMARNAGVHAAGVVVADEPLVEYLPVCKAPGQDTLVTQFDGPTVERVGLLKMDFLGLRTLTVLERARQLAEASTGTTIDLGAVDLTDPRVYELFARGETKGVFQFESGGMREVLMRMKPNRIEDLIAANALYRPGPMENIPDYIERKHGKSWTTPHPVMTEVLEETYGILVYQEQVSRLVHRLGGIELKRAFRLAKAISKKKKDMIEAMREPFLTGCEANGLKRRTAEGIFEDILKFGGYAFNKAHATGYALVAYKTAWMKVYHPVAFMTALLSLEMSNTDKIAEYREDCREMGIAVAPPDINRSDYSFRIERITEEAARGNGKPPADDEVRGVIRFGLGAIKGVGAKAVEAIIAARDEGGPFSSLFDFCERVDLTAVNRATLEALICAGAFDSMGKPRRGLHEALDQAITHGQTVQQDRRSGQLGLFGSDNGGAERPREVAVADEEWPEPELLAREKAVLGFYITRHPLASHERLLAACGTATTADLARHPDGKRVIVGGIVTHLRTIATRSGKQSGRRLGILTIEDLHGRVEVRVLPELLEGCRELLEPDTLLFVDGEVDRTREEPSLRAERLVAAEAATELSSAVILDMRQDTDLEALVELLRRFRGPTRVYLNVRRQETWVAQIECHASLRVACTPAFAAAVCELLGPEAVCFLGPHRRPIPLDGIRERAAAPVVSA